MAGVGIQRAASPLSRFMGWFALVTLIAAAGGILVNSGDDYTWTVLNNLASLLASGWATAAGAMAASRSRSRERLAWSVMAAGSGFWVIGQIAWMYFEVVLRSEPPMASWLDVAFLAAPILWSAAMMLFVVPPAGLRTQIRGGLEAIMIVGAAFLPAWMLIIEPLAAQSTESPAVVAVNLMYPLLDTMVLGTALFALTRPRLRSTGRLSVVASGLVIMSIADASYWYLTTAGLWQETNVTDSLWISGFAVMALGTVAAPRSIDNDQTRMRRWWLTMSPSLVYAIGIIATFCALAIGNRGRVTAWELLGIILLVAIGTAQRFAVMIENHHLTHGLETQVSRRTRQLAARERYFHSLVRFSSDIVTVVDPSLNIVWVSEAARTVYGVEPDALIGTPMTGRNDPGELARAIRSGLTEVQWQLKDPDGQTRWAHSTISDLRSDPDVMAYVVNTRDVTEQVVLESQLRHQAFHDPLTGLPNRALFTVRVTEALVQAKDTGAITAVAVVDLDGFKRVNDSHGHHAGDSVLQEVSTHLTNRLGPGIMVARLGGDEFAVLIENVGSVADAERIGTEISVHLRNEVTVGATAFETTGSVGVALAGPDENRTLNDLLRDADIAMYRAKSSRGHGAKVFNEQMHKEVSDSFAMEVDLRCALNEDQLRLFYQPVYAIDTAQIEGFEALIRWAHPTRGLVPPIEFIPVAESTGLIRPIGEWVMRTAIQQLREWSRTFSDGGRLTMSINVSAEQLSTDAFVSALSEEIERSGIAPNRLTVEITESIVVTENAEVVDRIRQISALGVRVAIDDFGTGYASIANLRQLPIDTLKIDKQFVAEGTELDEGLLGPMLQIGHAFGLSIIAEGIETSEQRERLRQLGCPLGQGYLFSPPLPASSVHELLQRRFPESMPPKSSRPSDLSVENSTSESTRTKSHRAESFGSA